MSLEFFKNKFGKENYLLLIYLIVVISELLVIRSFSDLPTELPNWVPKAQDLLNLKAPRDNFYGPGGAILILPFLWNGPDYFFATIFYTALGFVFYFKITQKIKSHSFRIIALIFPLVNVYLFWLFISSQDTVLEFAMYLGFLYFATMNRWIIATFFGTLVALTRSGYWASLILGVLTLYAVAKYNKLRFDRKAFMIFPLLFAISTFNFFNYGSPSPALEGGLTSYFGYAKHHYLSLPKFDMDVFLSGQNGDFANPKLQAELSGARSGAEKDQIYYKYARTSILENPKETVLGWMQKFESHLINIQKVPQLPGRYVYDSTSNSIRIENERLTWPLVLGNLIYEIYRFFLLFGGLIAFGIYLGIKKISSRKLDFGKLYYLFVFWIFSIIPAVLYYSETRFKIVQEMSLIPLVVYVFSELQARSKDRAR